MCVMGVMVLVLKLFLGMVVVCDGKSCVGR